MNVNFLKFQPGACILETAIALRIADDPAWEFRLSQWRRREFERLPFVVDGVEYSGNKTTVVDDMGERVAVRYSTRWSEEFSIHFATEVHL